MKNNIRKLRRERKLTQSQLADLTKVTRQTILAIENERYDPSLALAFLLAEVLETKVDDLFSFEEDNA